MGILGGFVSRLEPRVPHVCVLLSLLRSMPVVQATQAYPHLEKIKAGTVRTISGFVPDDDGGSVLAVLKNFSRLTNLNKSGLGLNADMMFAGSSRPKKYGKLFGNLAKGVFIHLCTKKTCNSYQHPVHLGEWVYVGDGMRGRRPVTRNGCSRLWARTGCSASTVRRTTRRRTRRANPPCRIRRPRLALCGSR